MFYLFCLFKGEGLTMFVLFCIFTDEEIVMFCLFTGDGLNMFYFPILVPLGVTGNFLSFQVKIFVFFC